MEVWNYSWLTLRTSRYSNTLKVYVSRYVCEVGSNDDEARDTILYIYPWPSI